MIHIKSYNESLGDSFERHLISEDMFRAALRDDVSLLMHAVRVGADVNERALSGDTPLHTAADYGSGKVAKKLIELGAKIDARNSYGKNPLHMTCYSPWAANILDVMRILLDAGADPNEGINSSTERTPLRILLQGARGPVHDILNGIKPLLEAGADPTIEGTDGKSPYSIAVENNFPQIIKMFAENGFEPWPYFRDSKRFMDMMYNGIKRDRAEEDVLKWLPNGRMRNEVMRSNKSKKLFGV